jgi:putative ABC transport system ATP-binding protein
MTAYRRSTVGVVFQAFNLVPSLTASENVQLPLRGAGISGRSSRRRSLELLEQVGLADRARHKPGQLSGGEQQRVAIARALAHDPPILLADEPTAHLDHLQVEGVLRLLRELAQPGRLVLVATHDERLVPLGDRVIQLSPLHPTVDQARRRAELAPGDVLFRQDEPSDLIWVVESGLIEIVRTRADTRADADDGEEILDRVGPKGYFGELGPLFGLRRSATARAADRTVVVGYSTREFREWIGPNTVASLLRGADR